MTHDRTEYQALLQEAAALFLARHQAQHLGNDQILFCRAVAHLVDSFSTSQATAENIVARAYGDMRANGDHRYMDVSNSTSSLALLVDPRTGICHAVPVAMIFQQLIDSPARRRLRSAN
ncbi:hypothetical protein CF98_00335 [Halopseudomonas bauzanensis]|nr:hypothetical protein CF98_00335 [Halopseudomonas bauzanensis]